METNVYFVEASSEAYGIYKGLINIKGSPNNEKIEEAIVRAMNSNRGQFDEPRTAKELDVELLAINKI